MKKTYNPFKMWGSYVGLVFMLMRLSYSLFKYGVEEFEFWEYFLLILISAGIGFFGAWILHALFRFIASKIENRRYKISNRKSKKKKKSHSNKKFNIVTFFIFVGFMLLLAISLMNYIEIFTLKKGGDTDNVKQIQDRVFEDALQQVKGIILINESSSAEVGNEINYSSVNLTEIRDLDNSIEKMKEERVALVLEVRDKLDSIFSKSIAYSMEKSKDVELNTNLSFNDLYSYYITIFDRRYDSELDQLYNYNEHIQTVQELIDNDYVGDCDDYALFLYTLACEKGLQVQYVFGHEEGQLGGHAWIQIKQKDIWMEYDSTSNRVCVDCISDHYPELNLVGSDC